MLVYQRIDVHMIWCAWESTRRSPWSPGGRISLSRSFGVAEAIPYALRRASGSIWWILMDFDGFWWILMDFVFFLFQGQSESNILMALIFGYLWLLGNAVVKPKHLNPEFLLKMEPPKNHWRNQLRCSNHIVHRLVTDCIFKAGAPWGPASVHLAKESSVFSRHDKKTLEGKGKGHAPLTKCQFSTVTKWTKSTGRERLYDLIFKQNCVKAWSGLRNVSYVPVNDADHWKWESKDGKTI